MRLLPIGLLLACLVAGPSAAQPAAAAQQTPPAAAGQAAGRGPDFNGAIRPIFVSRCSGCHGAQLQRGGLRLDDREAAFKGSAHGPVIVPGDSAGSRLFQMVASKRMPLDNELSVLELGAIKAWIDAGARWPEDRAKTITVDPRVDDFRLAVRNQDKAAIAKALADPTLLKARGRDGSTLLHHAVVFGSLGEVRALLDKGADANAANLDGVTPLVWGVRDYAIAALLVARGANVNAVTDGGATPLIAAAGGARSAGVVRLLISHGAKATEAQGPRLGGAVGEPADLDTLKAIFPAVLPANGLGAAEAAGGVISARCRACLDYLIAQGARGATLNDALVEAANGADATLVQRLLQLGATLDGKGPQGATVMIAAAVSDRDAAEKVRLLLAAGADVNAPDAHGRTPLTYARIANPQVVETLLAKGAK